MIAVSKPQHVGATEPSQELHMFFGGFPLFLQVVKSKDLLSAPLPTLQSETWLVHAKVREPHLNPPVRMNSLPLALVLQGKARKVHTNRGVQMWFANFRVNQPCFRLECRERC